MQYKIIVDKQPSSNPSSEKKEYTIDIEELRVKGNVYDSLVITKDEDYVMRRLSLSEYGVLTELEEPIKQPIKDINIKLFEGDNYIYLLDLEGNRMVAAYLVKNDFTDTFVTINQMNSTITQTAEEIELSVNQKLQGYATNDDLNGAVTELNSTIEQTASSITSTVSKTYATKNELTTAKSEIKQTTDSITSTVSQKVGKTEVISTINQTAGSAKINANKIELSANDILNLLAGNTINLTSENIVLSSTNFKVDKNGNVTANNATVNDITINNGTITLESDESAATITLISTDGDKAIYLTPIGISILGNNNSPSPGNMIQINTDNNNEPIITVLDSNMNQSNITGSKISTKGLEVISGDIILGTNADSSKVSFALHLKSMAHIYGNVTIDGNIYANNISSDKKLKDNIEDSNTSALDLINKIKHRQFEKKQDGKHYNIGYIAQELEEIDKNFVLIREKDEKEDEQYYVNELPLLATATKAIQELSAKVEELENKIKEVQSNG